MTKEITAEAWLHEAVTQIDKIVFNNALASDRGFQIYFGRTRGKRGAETVLPSQCENITLEDFFPITIGVDFQTQDVDRMLANLTLECLRAFFELTKGKAYRKKCQEYDFMPPFSEANPSPWLASQLKDVRTAVEKKLGEFPARPVKFPVKEPKEKRPSKAVYFCPECGLEYTTPIKKLNGNMGTPTCICGAKCGREEEPSNEQDNNASQENSKD